jgi:hypothetical protein
MRELVVRSAPYVGTSFPHGPVCACAAAQICESATRIRVSVYQRSRAGFSDARLDLCRGRTCAVQMLFATS